MEAFWSHGYTQTSPAMLAEATGGWPRAASLTRRRRCLAARPAGHQEGGRGGGIIGLKSLQPEVMPA